MNARIIFIGSGTSEGVPRVTCLAREGPACAACLSAVQPGSKDRRRNTSLLIQRPHPDVALSPAEPVGNVLLDAGKFFYQSAIDWFPKYQVRTLDAVVLTHTHADAAGGLDDLRDWTNNNRQPSIPVYVRRDDMADLGRLFFYLVDRSKMTSGGSVAKLTFSEVGPEAFEVAGVRFTPLPVGHGRPWSAYGYRFGGVCYLPDVGEIPDETRPLIEGCDLLILDALRPRRTHGSHLTLEQAVDEVRRLRPRRTLFTGMCHDIVHEPVNEELARLKETEGLDIQLAYDGLSVDVEL